MTPKSMKAIKGWEIRTEKQCPCCKKVKPLDEF